jgi:hypothetical protein
LIPTKKRFCIELRRIFKKKRIITIPIPIMEEPQIADDIEQDELQLEYDQLEENLSNLQKFCLLLKNPRLDDAAIKIKEQCIFRYIVLSGKC